MARSGAGSLRSGRFGDGRVPEQQQGRERDRGTAEPAPFVPERFERVDEAPRSRPRTGVGRSRFAPESERAVPSIGTRPRSAQVEEAPSLPKALADELASAAGPDWNHLRARMTERAASGIAAYERERYRDASRMLKTVADVLPNAPSIRELLGLCHYRLGNWRAALGHLESYATLTGSAEQDPVRMDCERALGRPRKVAALFDQLRAASPEPDVLAEGRLVMAMTMAENGDVGGGVDLLVKAGAGRQVRHPAERHLRQWYVLATLMERSGDVPKARELFARIQQVEPGAYDVEERLDSLGARRATRRRPAPR